MTRFIVNRSLQSVISLIFLVMLVFFIARMTGSPAALYLPPEATLGPRAAFICTLGFILPPILAVLLMAVMLDHVVTAPWVDAMMSGLAFAAMGLLLQICWHGLLRFRKHAWQLAVLAAVVICASGLGLSVPIVVAICGPVAIALAWRDAG